ncbi:flagellar biosynthetic protein FliR [Shimia sp. SDUM112013]|uniref:flagellar biosynthetic protein FliR n=1 Tax=Shimia sp. SDUM112013 TaxID=3136160 RepID=UPI0032EFDB07
MTNDLLQWAENSMLLAYFVFVRVGAIVALSPGFGEQAIPVRVKLTISVLLTLVVTPMVEPLQSANLDPVRFTIFTLSEATVGLILGVFLRVLVFALQIAGSIAAQATSLSQLLGGGGVEPNSAMGQILMLGGITLAMIMGLPEYLVIYISNSYSAFPIGAFPDPSGVAELGVERMAAGFSLAFQLAAPFLAISILYNLTLGAINRAMPQLMVVFVGAPAILLGTLVVLSLIASLILWVWWQNFERFLSFPPWGYL